jgi:hypothetical protein
VDLFRGARDVPANRRLVALAVVASLLLLATVPAAAREMPWRIYGVRDGAFVALGVLPAGEIVLTETSPAPPPLPPDWELAAWELADATGDGQPEWVLLVWRPWRDWAIQQWLDVPSPIAGFHDAAGRSNHLVLLAPRDGRELWAGSALPAPLLALAVGDVDGEGRAEVVTLEGDYADGAAGCASRIDVWQWVGFGFKLEYRSAPGRYCCLRLTATHNGGILDIAVR